MSGAGHARVAVCPERRAFSYGNAVHPRYAGSGLIAFSFVSKSCAHASTYLFKVLIRKRSGNAGLVRIRK
jgi:hypothetical protein